jgi:hypothetical protein
MPVLPPKTAHCAKRPKLRNWRGGLAVRPIAYITQSNALACSECPSLFRTKGTESKGMATASVAMPDHLDTYERILYYEIFEMRLLPSHRVTNHTS